MNFGFKEFRRDLIKYYLEKDIKNLINFNSRVRFLKGFYGVRAQCVSIKEGLVDDFVIETNDNIINLRNVPSPAATSCFAIAQHILDKIKLK